MNLALKNSGAKTIVVVSVKINHQLVTPANQDYPITSISELTDGGWAVDDSTSFNAGDRTTLVIAGTLADWVNGNSYKIGFYDGSNQVIGSAQQNAPGT
ncbi:MAG: hypothetical protein ACBZ72_09600 [Candidatus Bathyarchaeia archaeon]|jgi:hypothetical protein